MHIDSEIIEKPDERHRYFLASAQRRRFLLSTAVPAERNGARFRSAQLERRAIGIRRAGFAEIRRALPRSYRESRKAVSTVVFGPAVSLERSTPLLRGSHAENKNISPAACSLARSFASFSHRRAWTESAQLPVDGGPSIQDRGVTWTGGCPLLPLPARVRARNSRRCGREPAPKQCARSKHASRAQLRRRVELLAYLTKSVT